MGKNFFLDEVGPVRGFVSVAPVSLVWKDRVGRFEVKLTQGLSVSLQAQYSWTIPIGALDDPDMDSAVFTAEGLRGQTNPRM